MAKAGKIILNVIAIIAVAASIAAVIRPSTKEFSPWRVYACDFRLLSAVTCNLPLAANTTRIPISPREADHEKRVAYRERIVACEREKAAKRRRGELVPARKCWDESPTSLVNASSR